jgi:hypothetical protein
MKIAIMQPYLFPYIGYFQLINAVDVFVVYDNVQYIKGGWINRNRVLVKDAPHLFTFSIKKEPIYFDIKDRFFSDKFIREKENFLKTIHACYSRAPNYIKIFPLIKSITDNSEKNVAKFIMFSLQKISEYLGIETSFIYSTAIPKSNNQSSSERLIEIVKYLRGNIYINPIGGIELYSKDEFINEGIQLILLKSNDIVYNQFREPFVPWLSIIDVLMFNSVSTIMKFLSEYEEL